MDAKLVMPFLRSMENTFSTLLMMDVKFHEPVVGLPVLESEDCYGVINLEGDIKGHMSIKFPEAVASQLIETMTGGMEVPFRSDDFADAINEMVNMVSGSAKGEFEKMDETVTTSSMVKWEKPGEMGIEGSPSIEIPCSCDAGTFSVELAVDLG